MNYLMPATTERISSDHYPDNLRSLFIPPERTTDIDRFLRERQQSGKKYALLGIPEGIGPVANRGRPGAEGGWQAFLKYFPVLWQNNTELAEQVIILGKVKLDDLMAVATLENYKAITDRTPLRHLVSEIDRRVSPIIKSIFAAGLTPLVVGGGHNNAYPLLREAGNTLLQKQGPALSCLNIDLHADLRAKEGRHSGNAFTYAINEGFLKGYYIFGLYELYHSPGYLQRIQELHAKGIVDYSTYHQITQHFEASFQIELNRAIKFIQSLERPVGLEVDLDGVEGIPTSAITEVRIPFSFVRQAIRRVTRQTQTLYLNISEGAPSLGKRAGERVVGRAINHLIIDYINANNRE